jgi:DNA-binding transcriptional regulator YdaS (Cro superfamily)
MSHLAAALEKHEIRRSRFAVMAGVDKATVTRWAQNKVPAERVVELERLTGISRHDLRPDIFGKPEDAS